MIWRSRDAQLEKQGPKPEGPTSEFLLLREIEASALDVLRPYLSEKIPCDFVLALMKSAADATTRFMLANPVHANRYRRLGFEMFWSGLATGEISKERKK